MDSENTQDTPASTENVSSDEVVGESNNIDSLDALSSAIDSTLKLQSAAELLTRVELDLACSSEKLVNLGILILHVASRENDFEAFGSDKGHGSESPARAERALEFDLLYGYLESEVREQESFLSDLQREIDDSREFISLFKGHHFDIRELDEKLQDCVDSLKLSFEQVSDMKAQSASLESEVREQESFLSDVQREIDDSREFISSFKGLHFDLRELDEKLQDCVDSLRLSFKQVSDIKAQSASFQKLLLASSGDEQWTGEMELSSLENDSSLDINAKIKMQTAEQQRDILRMLEKSLAREMDLEKKLSESRQTDEELKFRLQQEVYSMEEEAEDMWERLFEAENSAEVFVGISKELFGLLQTAQSSLNESTHREGELRSKLQDLTEQVRVKDGALEGSKRSWAELLEKVHSLEQKLRESESKLQNMKDSSEKHKDLEVKVTEAEKRAEIIEAECVSLKESNMGLEKDVTCLKNRLFDATERVEQLERQLKESEHKRLHAVASAEASQEKQCMLEHTIKDMEGLIKDLKSKVLKAENQTESVEEKCIFLSETNEELLEEVNFLSRKLIRMEKSLHEADEAKKETAKDIKVRTKLIMDLVMQLAFERERLCEQISSLTKEKKVAVKYLQRLSDPTVTVIKSHDAKVNVFSCSESDNKNKISTKESDEGIMGSSSTSDALDNEHSNSPTTQAKTSDADTTSEFKAVRNIDARQLKFKAILILILTVAIPVFGAFLFRLSGIQT